MRYYESASTDSPAQRKGGVNIENIPELLDYLHTTGRIGPGELPQCRVMAGGVSNRTVLVARPSGEQWVLKQALAKLRVVDDWFSPPERILREAAGMAALCRIAPAESITRLLFTDAENFLLAMEAVPEPHENWKTVLLAGRVEREHIQQFANLLVAVHRGGTAPEFKEEFDDRSYFESLRIEPYYLTTAARVPPARAFIDALVEETRGRRLTLVHGDYSPKNILIHQGRLVLLDHEVIHFGDPAFDIGFSMAHLLSKAHHLKNARPVLAAAARRYWQVYAQNGGLAAEGPSVRHTLGCLLARVAGRSPLEYLDQEERRRQQWAVGPLLGDPPGTMPELTERFLACL
jgi:aminoglycoside phosphotransferase (APT) family kinase protein